ncbi:formylglycine-generating enzyme family protein [Endozoicomonas lisbonensis]|uniref:formylglycine-generating enzyme family protein n=1 Tax=Endozoicomonas lisbonensis TaxID=3120522 RepID=UPI003399770F
MEHAVNGELLQTARPTEKELEFVKSKANRLSKNTSGYWEADFGDGITLIYVPAGSFTMGNNALSEKVVKESEPASPEHRVSLDHYWISKTPITIGQFRKFVEDTKYVTDVEQKGSEGPFIYDFPSSGFLPKKGYYWDNAFKDVIKKYPEITVNDQHPVNCVSWNDAIAYTRWLKSRTGLKFTLPTEAEWEYAARGSDGRIYPWGNEAPDGKKANYADDTFDKYFPGTEQSIVDKGTNDGYAITSPVGVFPEGKSPIGALDMAGNVTEWVYDSFYKYENKPMKNPISLKDNNIRMMKAGFWAGSAGRSGAVPDELVFGHNIRSDARQGDDQNSADDHLGFRIAISYVRRDR